MGPAGVRSAVLLAALACKSLHISACQRSVTACLVAPFCHFFLSAEVQSSPKAWKSPATRLKLLGPRHLINTWRVIPVVGTKLSAQVINDDDAPDVLRLSIIKSQVGLNLSVGKSMFEQKSLTFVAIDKCSARS
jgi:hypothetical protein